MQIRLFLKDLMYFKSLFNCVNPIITITLRCKDVLKNQKDYYIKSNLEINWRFYALKAQF